MNKTYYESDYLSHYGVLGMKWGVRRYQNKDGSLTAKGKSRLEERHKQIGTERLENRVENLNKEIDKKSAKLGMRNIKGAGDIEKNSQYVKKVAREIKNDPERLQAFGKRTMNRRIAAITSETLFSSIAGFAGSAALAGTATVPAAALVIALPSAAIAVGSEYLRRLTYK